LGQPIIVTIVPAQPPRIEIPLPAPAKASGNEIGFVTKPNKVQSVGGNDD